MQLFSPRGSTGTIVFSAVILNIILCVRHVHTTMEHDPPEEGPVLNIVSTPCQFRLTPNDSSHTCQTR